MTPGIESGHGREMSLKDAKMMLSAEVQRLLPDANMSYYESTNELHIGNGEGGSKFEGVSNIMEVIGKVPDLAGRVKERAGSSKAPFRCHP